MTLYQLATYIAIPLLGLGSLAVFIAFLYEFFKHPPNDTPTNKPQS